MEPLVTVVVPAYKAEKYVEDCIESVLSQNYKNLQVVLVDDGSPDRCPVIYDEYAEKYSFMEVIHRENGGLWAARNSGLEAAVGKYVFFLDSDDMLDGEDAIRCLVEKAEEANADITVGAYRKLSENGLSDVIHHNMKDSDDSSTAAFRFKGFYRSEHLSYNWGKLYRMEFIRKNSLYLHSFPFTQDKFHNMACYACKPVYAFVEDSVYRYRINENSITFKYKENYLQVWISIASEFEEFVKERHIEEDLLDFSAIHILWGSFFLAKQELQYRKEKRIKYTAEKLKEYAANSFAADRMKMIAKGKYLDGVDDKKLKFVMKMAAKLFCGKFYGIFARVCKAFYKL